MTSLGENLEKYRIPLDEILRVTRNFSSETLIGDGGFGMVHIGQLSEEWQKRRVAIKRLNRDGCQGKDEFHNELKMVSSFHHPNIITFIGYCDEADEMIIVYEYAQNGSLDRHLQNPDKMRSLTWAQRLKICLGAAKGLKYLHSRLGEHNRVIHRDVKSANILLDENLEAKICDFGLSRFGARNEKHTQILTNAAGTRYYMDPLYAERSRLTKESDIYSFGVVMFEMSSGTLVYHPKCFGEDAKPLYLIDVVRSYYDDRERADGRILIDPIMRDHIVIKSFYRFNKIAHECLNLKSKERPAMARITRKIEQALNIQLNHNESPSTISTPSLESFLIPLKDINWATQNFNVKTRIGNYEPYGAVHKAHLYGRWQNRTMAIRRLYQTSVQNESKYYKELQIISSFHHQNISPFIGYCDQANERIIIHEYALNGSLADYLDDLDGFQLTWAQRLKICVGVARGLQYLHLALGEDNEVTRGNINSRNILLDGTMEAKIYFHGFSKQAPLDAKRPNERVNTSDMYSFGVILFEMFSGYPSHALDKKVDPDNQVVLLEEFYHDGSLDQFVDRNIKNEIDSECYKICKEIAYYCMIRDNQWARHELGPARTDPIPCLTMDKVVEKLALLENELFCYRFFRQAKVCR